MELLDFSAFGELVEAVNKSNKPAAPAPVSENPDRQYYQSTVTGASRQFEPEALPQRGDRGTDVSNMQQALVDAGVTSIKKVDGAFGRNTEKGVQEFQQMRGLPETGIYDEETRSTLLDDTARMPDSDEPTASRPAPVTVSEGESSETSVNFLKTGTFKLLKGVEGFKSKPYSLNASEKIGGKPHKSGLTVGAGIDFGQHTRESLESIGLPKTMLDKAENAGWIGLNPDTIVDPDTGKPAATRKRGHELMFKRFNEQKSDGTLPDFTEGELSLSTPLMYKPYEDSAKKQMDSKFGEGTYDSLGEGTKAVLTLEKYHRGEPYILPDAMLEGALSGNPLKAAEGISWSSRRKNMKDWIKKVGLTADTVPETSPRPVARPEAN